MELAQPSGLGPVGLGKADSSISSFFKDMPRPPGAFASGL